MRGCWSEYSHAEIMSMHGVEIDDPAYNEDDTNFEQEDCCPRCSGGGCNYCLMCEY
jgi:hypothetical protein